MKKIKELEELAMKLIGDGKNPNLFFVSENGNIILVTTDGDIAYAAWSKASLGSEEAALEDRKNGTISSKQIDEAGDDWVLDDYEQFIKRSK